MVNSVLAAVYQQLTAFSGLDSFWSKFDTVFGTQYNFTLAQSLRSQWQSGDFSQLPTIQVVSDEILGNARGAYASSTNVIYLAASLVATGNSKTLEAVILEEIGHFVDAQVNSTDTAGDEGEYFAKIVLNQPLSEAEITRLKTEDDHAIVVIGGKTVAIEQAVTQVGAWDRLSYANAVAVVGNYVYAVGDTLEIIDISNLSSPIFKGNYSLPSEAYGIQVLGNYAYVAESSSGLQIIDISNPNSPSLISSFKTSSYYAPGYVYGLQVVGNYAYVADGYSLQIINISNPNNPSRIALLNVGTVYGVQVVGSYAYITNSTSGLKIFNISNPYAPTLVSSYDTPGEAYGIQVVGNYAYVADDTSGLQIINISNPNAPTLTSSYNTPGNSRGVQVVGNYAYIADDTSGLQIINISNPNAPTLTSSYNTPGNSRGVQVVGNYAYVADYYSGLQIIDISNLNALFRNSFYGSPGRANGIQVVENYAYIANGDSGLQIINVSNSNSLNLVASYNTSKALDVQVVGNYAYVADWSSGLKIVSVNNPATPTLAGSYDTPGVAWQVQVIGNYAYVADGLSGLQIINISNPNAPTLAGSYNTPGYANGVQVAGNYAYVADQNFGLQIINISNPNAPTLAGSYNTPGNSRGVQVVGNYAYVADDTSGLQIINISNPNAPTLAGSYDTPGNSRGVQVVGNYAYVADDTSGLQIINISNPNAPTLAGSYDTPGYANGVQVLGNYAYVADDMGGLKILDVSDFTNPPNQAPTNITLSTNTLAENQPIGTAIGIFSTTDPDTGNTFTYSLVSGIGSTDNALFTIVGNQLRSNSIFDFETKNSYSIRVRTTDQGSLTFEKQLTINISDLNEITGNPLINNGRTPIVGTAAPDYITGLAGAKTLTGGGGNDFFVFTNMQDVGQRIADFTVGEDKLVFTQLFSSLGYTGSNPIGDGYIKFSQGMGANSAHTFLQIDRDGLTGSAIARNFLQVDNITPTQLNNLNNFQF